MASNQQQKQTDNKQYTQKQSISFFLRSFPVFLPPKPDRKYSHTNSYIYAVTTITQDDHRSQLELAGVTCASTKSVMPFKEAGLFVPLGLLSMRIRGTLIVRRMVAGLQSL